jgi:hypothetical protein
MPVVWFTELPEDAHPAPDTLLLSHSDIPLVELTGEVYSIDRDSLQEYNIIKNNCKQHWWGVRQQTGKHVMLMLYSIPNYVANPSYITRHAIAARRFPMQYLQYRVRRFLAKRRRDKIFALAMAWHPRLGAESKAQEGLQDDVLRLIHAKM